ncbi:MAG: hypothetical protein AAF557_06110 [Pseudomonadota bacterium]
MLVLSQLTANTAQDRLGSDGAAALGLTAPLLSPVWFNDAASEPGFNADQLELTPQPGGGVLMPFLGILETIDTPRDVFDVSGSPLTGPVTRIRLHPQAAARLITLARGRYAQPDAPFHHPVATQMVIRDATNMPESPNWWEPGDPLALNGPVTMHDTRGLIVCPVAAAAMYADLLDAYPALLSLSGDAPVGSAVDSDGGVETIAALDTGTAVHIVDPHGGAFAPVGPTLTRRDGDAVLETLGSAPVTLLGQDESFRADVADEDAEAAANDDDAPDTATGARLRWGWSNDGQLARTTLEAPVLAGGALARQFLRLTVVDLHWHLLGNRTTSPVMGIAGDDGLIPETYQPKVRPDLPVDYLGDGISTLAACGEVIDRGATGEGEDPLPGQMILAVSPMFDQLLQIPPAADMNGRWPVWPAGGNAPFAMPVVSPAGGMSAQFTAENDVVLTLAADSVPDGAHVRAYPRQFVEILAIDGEPSFVRGDGGAAIATALQETELLLPDPFRVGSGDLPLSPTLTVDLAVTPRVGPRQLFAGIQLPVAAGNATPPAPIFDGDTSLIGFAATALGFFASHAPSPVFGIPNLTDPAPGTPATLVELLRSRVSEEVPRIGPRLPGQARFETLIVTGIPDGGANGVLAWDGVVTGARWSAETLSSRHRDGNPGNPAGPDTHAPGIRVGGDLGLDIARHAAKRAQPILPLGPETPSWLVMQGGNNFNRPSTVPANAASAPNAGAGALLKTVAAFCETPEFGPTGFDLPEGPVDAQAGYDAILAAIGNALGLAQPPDIEITIGNEDRLGTEIVKEIYQSRHGSRDALWALNRALGQAREFVYIESPQFARTARPEDFGGQIPAHAIDLAEVLAQRLAEMQSLHVAICIPRAGDFVPNYGGWVRESLEARNEAVEMLRAAGPGRVAVFHPKGFPGRHAALRTTSVIVDDCWAMVGTSHFRRRGMTYDGAADVVSIPYGMRGAAGGNITAYRRETMARKLGLEPALAADRRRTEWARLSTMRGAFQVIDDLLKRDGAGMISPLWPGPTDNAVLTTNHDVADPDGADGASLVASLGSLIGLADEDGDPAMGA